MALGLVSEILDPVDVILLFGKDFWVVDSEVVKLTYTNSVIGAEVIRAGNAVGGNLFPDDRYERCDFGRGNDCS